jgi:hypothetical protein
MIPQSVVTQSVDHTAATKVNSKIKAATLCQVNFSKAQRAIFQRARKEFALGEYPCSYENSLLHVNLNHVYASEHANQRLRVLGGDPHKWLQFAQIRCWLLARFVRLEYSGASEKRSLLKHLGHCNALQAANDKQGLVYESQRLDHSEEGSHPEFSVVLYVPELESLSPQWQTITVNSDRLTTQRGRA